MVGKCVTVTHDGFGPQGHMPDAGLSATHSTLRSSGAITPRPFSQPPGAMSPSFGIILGFYLTLVKYRCGIVHGAAARMVRCVNFGDDFDGLGQREDGVGHFASHSFPCSGRPICGNSSCSNASISSPATAYGRP